MVAVICTLPLALVTCNGVNHITKTDNVFYLLFIGIVCDPCKEIVKLIRELYVKSLSVTKHRDSICIVGHGLVILCINPGIVFSVLDIKAVVAAVGDIVTGLYSRKVVVGHKTCRTVNRGHISRNFSRCS